MAAPETMQARQAALWLHGLPPAAQSEVLAKLDSRETARLKPLLEELVALGVSPSMGQQMQPAVAGPPAVASASTAASAPVLEPSARERVDRLSGDEVARCLQTCSPATIAQLLRAGNWSWKAQVVGLIPEPRRTHVLDHVRRESPALAPAVLVLLFERVLQQAARLTTLRPQPGSGAAVRCRAAGWRSESRAGVRARFMRLIRWTR
jgi:hypothetical protein